MAEETQCEYCLRVWDGNAQCDCMMYYEVEEEPRIVSNESVIVSLQTFLEHIKETKRLILK